jgi:sulfane dehydrogenase subunit SoxC
MKDTVRSSSIGARLTPRARPPMDPDRGVRSIKLAPHQLADQVTPTDGLFVLAHLGVPRVDAAQWSLVIDGLVDRDFTLTLDELKAMPKTVVESVHNCCGSPLEPRVPTRRVANVRWGGVDLARLLDQLGVDADARYLWSYGLDGGEFAGRRCDWFVKDLPIERLTVGGVLVAYELNGEPLPVEHGFPARLVVPGYYGTNSVKWLWRLCLADRRADGLFASELYNDDLSDADVAAGLPKRGPVWAIAPDSIIVTPPPDAVLAKREPVEISGWAWSFREIEAVEVSTDGGENFARAALEERRRWAWRRFTLSWKPARAGETTIVARAIEAGGTAQPRDGARNAVHAVRVTIS